MLRSVFLVLSLLSWSDAAWSGAVFDATGRSVAVPEQISRVLPAGPPAAILLAAVAPDLMLGWPSSLSDKARAGWQIVAPEGDGPMRRATMADVRALDPDVIVFTDPAVRTALAESEPWRSLRAAREGHAVVSPSIPFGWIDEPPSINRLLGLAWLGGSDPRTLAPLFNAVVYGHVLTASQVDVVVAGAHALQR
jgi:iron complex transport system substrate-binding protein